jgi:hypothetical protein
MNSRLRNVAITKSTGRGEQWWKFHVLSPLLAESAPSADFLISQETRMAL